MKKNSKYWNEIAAYLSGEMSDKQAEEFLLKVEGNKELNNDYRLMKNTWNKFDSNPDEKYSDTVNAWNALNTRILKEGMYLETNPKSQMSNMQYILRIAAVIIIILAVGIPSLYYSGNEFGMKRAMIEHRSEQGTLTVDLPDGSRVFLNEGAKLDYSKSFEEKREVTLKGEGYFDVMADPKRPFRVNAGKVVVTVLGTSFNVKESENEPIQVYVESGKVRVDMEETDHSIILEPGQVGEAGNELLTISLQDENYLSWKTKDFKFVDESISNILDVLEKAYHVEVSTMDIVLDDMRLTTSYSDQSFDAILSTICTALNMNYNKEGKVYILHSN